MLIVPFNCQILDFPVLIIQRLEDTINSSGSSVVVIMKEIWLANSEYLAQIVQGHEPGVWICLMELRQ